MNRLNIIRLLLAAGLLISACILVGMPPSAPPAPPAETQPPLLSPQPTPTAFIPPATATAPVETPAPTPTPDPYAGLTIDDLAARTYGGGAIQVEQLVGQNPQFIRYLFSYPSDGLAIHGFLNIPQGDGPFPVIIALHGYIDPAVYQTYDYTTPYADTLAANGFLVLHPNLRGYRPSDDGPNRFRVGFAIDVLNLIALVKSQAGQPGLLEKADAGRIGIWGHSMGGGVSIRVLTLNPDIQAAVLYGAMSADDQKNYERIYNVFTDNTRGGEEILTAPQDFARISPVSYLDRIQAAVSIHHGEADATVPPEWSQELCQQLGALGKSVECFSYPGQPHTFTGEGSQLFEQRVVEFYRRILQ